MEPVIRIVSSKDAEGMIAFGKAVGCESEFLSYGTEGLGYSLEEEEKILASFEKGNKQVMLLALIDGEIVGSLGFNAGKRPRVAVAS